MGKESHYYHKVTKGVTLVTEYHSHSHITSNIRTMGDKVYSYNSSYVKTLDLVVEYMF